MGFQEGFPIFQERTGDIVPVPTLVRPTVTPPDASMDATDSPTVVPAMVPAIPSPAASTFSAKTLGTIIAVGFLLKKALTEK